MYIFKTLIQAMQRSWRTLASPSVSFYVLGFAKPPSRSFRYPSLGRDTRLRTNLCYIRMQAYENKSMTHAE